MELTQEQQEKVFELFCKEGLAPSKIAEKLEISDTDVRFCLLYTREPPPPKPPEMTDEDWEEAWRLYNEEGLSLEKVGKRFGRTREAIRKRFRWREDYQGGPRS